MLRSFLGLCNKRLRRYEDSLDSFYKLHGILRNSPQVIYQIADIHDQMRDPAQATEWFVFPSYIHIPQQN